MPKIAATDPGEVDALFADGGASANTMTRRQKILEEFQQFVANRGQGIGETFETIKPKPERIERLFVEFLNSLRVNDRQTGEETRPKDSYFEFYKSMLKCALKAETGFNLDDVAMFPNLNKGFKAIKKDSKR